MTLEVWSAEGGTVEDPRSWLPLAKPESQAPRQCPLCCLGGVRLGLQAPPGTSQLQGPAGPARAWLLCVCLGGRPSPQAWTQVAGTVPVDPQRVGLAPVLLQDFWGRDCHLTVSRR